MSIPTIPTLCAFIVRPWIVKVSGAAQAMCNFWMLCSSLVDFFCRRLFRFLHVFNPENVSLWIFPEQITLVHVDGVNMMGVGVVAVVLGVMLHGMGERGKPLLRVFDVIFDIKMKMMFKLI